MKIKNNNILFITLMNSSNNSYYPVLSNFLNINAFIYSIFSNSNYTIINDIY